MEVSVRAKDLIEACDEASIRPGDWIALLPYIRAQGRTVARVASEIFGLNSAFCFAVERLLYKRR